MRPLSRPARASWHGSSLNFYAFTHFGMNTFTNREWGDGTEDPALFNPDALDADQWVAAVKKCRHEGADSDLQAP